MRRTLPALLMLMLLSPLALADTVPEGDEETILSPILSPVHLRLMGVCEFAFVASDSKLFHKFPAAFRRPFPGQWDQDAEKTLQFGFEELTLVFDAASSAKTAGFHGAVLVTGSGSEPDTFSTPALLEAWGYYRISMMQISAGRVRNPFGGRFTDLPEYHMQVVDYRRFRGDGLRLDFDLAAGDLHFHPSLAIMERNHDDVLFLYSGRLGMAYHIKNFGVLGFGASLMYGEDSLRITSYPNAGWLANDGSWNRVNFDERFNVRRLDFGFDLSVVWEHPTDSFFGNTAFHAEFILGSINDAAFDDDPPDTENMNPGPPFIGEREPMGWWVEFSQWFNYGAGGGPFVAFGYLDRRIEPQAAWGIGEQGIVREIVIGYRQAIARGFNVDVELWIVDDDKRLDDRQGGENNGAPDFDRDGKSDLVQGNFVKVRFQFIF
jgi:hypothetical protein